MILRLKIRGQSEKIDLGATDTSSLTLGALKDLISVKFNIGNGQFGLSLNKQDVLSGDETVLADFGIVKGDLVHVVTEDDPVNRPAIRQRPRLLVPYGQGLNTNQHNASHDDVPAPVDPIPNLHAPSASASGSSLDSQAAGASSRPTRRSIHEALAIRESTAHHVPAFLQELYSTTDITCPNDALFLLLHALMIESGFFLPGEVETTRLPPDWKRPSYYLCKYLYMVTEGVELECGVMAMPVGSSMIVHGLSSVGDYSTAHVQLKAEHYVRDETQESAAAAFRSLDRLTTTFKDTVVQSLQNHLATSAGYRETQGLLSLPSEIKTRLMCYLDAKSVCNLGQTCQQLRSLYREGVVWRQLYIQTYGKPGNTSLDRNWYELYKGQHRQYMEQQENRRRFLMDVPDEDDFVYPWFNPPFNPPRPFFPPRFLPDGPGHGTPPEENHQIRHQGLCAPSKPLLSNIQERMDSQSCNLMCLPLSRLRGFF